MSNIAVYSPSDPTVANRVLHYFTSVNTPDYDSENNKLVNPDVSGLSGVPYYYWKFDGDDGLEEMSVGEKALIDSILFSTAEDIQRVEVIEDRTGCTEGTFQGCMWEWAVPDEIGWHKLTATEETSSDPLKFPFDIAMLYASWSCDSSNVGDLGKFVAGEWTAIGAITQNVSADDTVINVSSTVTENVCKGCDLKVDDEIFSRMVSKSVSGGTITLESGATDSHTAGAYVYARKVVARRIYFDNQQVCRFDFGGNRIGGTRLPANTEANLWYYNADGAEKKFRLYIEYVI